MLDFLMVLPTYNEKDAIAGTIAAADRQLSKMFRNYKIVVVDESSPDGTSQAVHKLQRIYKRLDLISGRQPASRGLDVRYAMSKYDSKLYFFMDADLKDSVPCITDAVRIQKEGYDMVVGSKYLKGSVLRRPPIRNFVSRPYNATIRFLFSDGILDHQCGFKLFTKKAFRVVNGKSRERHWLWDTEAILIAKLNELKLGQVRVNIIEKRKKPASLYWVANLCFLFAKGIFSFTYRFKIMRDY